MQHLWDTNKDSLKTPIAEPLKNGFTVYLTKEGAIVEGKQLGQGAFNVVRRAEIIGKDVLSRQESPNASNYKGLGDPSTQIT